MVAVCTCTMGMMYGGDDGIVAVMYGGDDVW